MRVPHAHIGISTDLSHFVFNILYMRIKSEDEEIRLKFHLNQLVQRHLNYTLLNQKETLQQHCYLQNNRIKK